ncbi:hypothetical protein ATANTOWER_019279 [Ataeniobius toweri]|uniref:Secreted protein n=1 Tax=Ataeniobius toweri TaxID=208326 RepID=A0ABU7BA36_9TELE|nr:hypothetical protein [Ataeniobius toweri]
MFLRFDYVLVVFSYSHVLFSFSDSVKAISFILSTCTSNQSPCFSYAILLYTLLFCSSVVETSQLTLIFSSLFCQAYLAKSVLVCVPMFHTCLPPPAKVFIN